MLFGKRYILERYNFDDLLNPQNKIKLKFLNNNCILPKLKLNYVEIFRIISGLCLYPQNPYGNHITQHIFDYGTPRKSEVMCFI